MATDSPAAEKEETSTFPKAGLKISYVVGDLIEELGGVDRLKGMTTEDVCQQIVKLQTIDAHSSYCDLLRCQRHKAYGAKAQAFISHARSYLFLDFISALRWLLRNEPDTIVWIDILSINQHEPMDWTFDWLSTTFKSAVRVIGRTIMVMSPWDNPLPFTRAWCVFEAFCTAVADGTFEIAMSMTDETNFLENIREYPDDVMNDVLATIRSDKSQCAVETDRNSIFSAIQSTVGFSKLDAMVFERYREWAIRVVLYALDTLKEEEDEEGGLEHKIEKAKLLNAVGRLYSRMGNYHKAEIYTKRSMDAYAQALGENHESTVSLKNNIARVLYVQGKYEEARDLFASCFEQRKDILGEDHPDTLITMSKLALTYAALGKYEEARSSFEACLDRRLVTLGKEHPSTLKTMHHLGTVLFDQGKYEEAELLCSQTYEQSILVLGEAHPDTLRTMNGLASALDRQGKYEEALALLESCLERRKTIIGEDHPFTLHTIHRLAKVLINLGKVDRARTLLESCLERRTTALGTDHPDTLSTVHNLASHLGDQGEHDRALELFGSCLERRKHVLGSTHPHTLATMYEMASVLGSRGHYDQSRALHEHCLAGQREVLGEGHPSTLETKSSLGRLAKLEAEGGEG